MKEIAKSIYDAIQVRLEGKGYCPRFLNLSFNKDGDFERYIFSEERFDSTRDSFKCCGIERMEYANMSVEDIEEELNNNKKNSVKIWK